MESFIDREREVWNSKGTFVWLFLLVCSVVVVWWVRVVVVFCVCDRELLFAFLLPVLCSFHSLHPGLTFRLCLALLYYFTTRIYYGIALRTPCRVPLSWQR